MLWVESSGCMSQRYIEYMYEPLKADRCALNRDDNDSHVKVDKAKSSRPGS